MQLTVIPCSAIWSDKDLAHAVVAERTAFDNIKFGIGCLTEVDVLTIMRPQPPARMRGRHRRVSRIADIRFRSIAAYQSSSARLSNMPGFGPPALLNTIFAPSNSSTVIL